MFDSTDHVWEYSNAFDNFCCLLQDHDRLMVDEINDVRIIGVITAVAMLLVAFAGLSWESKVTNAIMNVSMWHSVQYITILI